MTKTPFNRKRKRLHKFLTAAGKLLLFLLFAAVARGQSALDGFDPNANGEVHVVVVQPDGKILLGGNFTTLSPNGGAAVTRNRIARLNPDGTLDALFNPNADNYVRSIALQADGKILVGGYFDTIGGQTRNRIARLDATTGLADSFSPNANGGPFGVVGCITVQADGKILVGGNFFQIGGQTRNNIARLDAITSLADSFNPNASGTVLSIAVQSSGKILAGGSFTSIGGQTRNYIARLEATSGLADSFNPDANDIVFSIAIQADGKILAAGSFNGPNSIGGQTRNHIARLDATSGAVDSFNPNANSAVMSTVVQPDGKILALGNFTNIGGQMRNRLGRLEPATGLADSLNPNPNTGVQAVAVQADGKILAGGFFTGFTEGGGPSVTRNYIARLETDGRLDRTLNLSIVAAGFDAVLASAVQPDGKTLIGGRFNSVLGVPRNNIARLNTDGTLDVIFNPSANDIVTSIVVQTDGKILVGGYFHGANSIGGQARNYIARLDATSGLADSFDPNASDFGGFILSIVVQPDGKILVGGGFGNIGGQTRNNIARLSPTTGLADSFDPSASGIVHSIALQDDGKILVGGEFDGANSIGGQPRRHIARLDPATGLADSFNPSANRNVNAIVVQSGGKIIVGGYFSSIGGQTRNYMARLDATTGLADSFDPNANGNVLSVALQADGKILVGGAFTSIGGQLRSRIARLAATGLADSFDPNVVIDVYAKDVFSIAAQADGKILVGGQFDIIGGQARYHFARLSNDRAALQYLGVTQTTITWTLGGSGPQFTRTAFEYSSDNAGFTSLGNGSAIGDNWTLTGLSLPTDQTFYIRARGYYRSGYFNGSESITEVVRNAFLPTPTTLGNISTRLRVETGDNVLIGGFIVTGTQPKKIIVRAIGPSLPLAGALADPVLELRNSSGALIRSNDNWREDPAQESEIIATGIPPLNNLEAAIVETLPANGSAYTAIVRGLDNGTGIGVVEAYDLDQTVNSKLANISTRGLVQTGDDVLIGGLIVLGQNQLRVIVRAIGPSLPFSGTLADPTLNLHDGNGTLVASNDNWREDPVQESAIIATGIPPSDDLESAMVHDLTPGSYTAIVRGVNNTTGIAVVEAYGLN